MANAHVYVAPGFEEVEMITIVDVLRRADIDTTMVALTSSRAVTGAHGITVQADIGFDAAEGILADALILPGGGPGTAALQQKAELVPRLHSHLNAGKIVAALCAAPTVLARAGMLSGRKATCFPGNEEVLREGGATVTAANVVNDGQVTTSRGAGTAGLFALDLVRQLAGEERAREIGRAMLYL
ncbi:4-methyl-5(b-hydroxyethyl)-thiazole monophosphate biosynthesis [Silvimonas terrae]|uniref:4-methyl-5(B-hydroxyethyl)-thiazole monophosphate biosynthesis n=1 Tax=Silvimonas terrae TaxID=300266 RepID=A0A840R945_9NEIS|nr:DJ-1 family glyoxalase III [Silvimonas terrae]MBB5189865.1 4-methyl-5(b-hydroxyethyl)-thiazole monophosphate biosynthesis [Silvimonas terrae]